MAAPGYIREDQFNIQVAVVGITFPFTTSWQSKEGGVIQTNAVKSHPGGMMGEIALGGPSSRSDATVKRIYTHEIDSFVPLLEGLCGLARASISWTSINANVDSQGNLSVAPTGHTHVITGYLKEVVVPNADANASAVADLSLVLSCDQFQQGAGQ